MRPRAETASLDCARQPPSAYIPDRRMISGPADPEQDRRPEKRGTELATVGFAEVLDSCSQVLGLEWAWVST